MPEFKGIDVSSWQERIAWDKVRKDGIQFAMIRASYSDSPDRYFSRNIVHALDNNIQCGAYVFSGAVTADDARREADLVLETVKPYQLSYPIAFNMEDQVHYLLSNAQRTRVVQAFCQAMEKSGYHPAIYASLYWFNVMLDLEKLEPYDKWVSQWSVKCTFKGKYGLWQNSSRSLISGIDGYVNTDIAYEDYPALLCAKNERKPPKGIVLPPGICTGARFSARQIPLFKTAGSPEKSRDISGVYWIYDEKPVNGRLKVTNMADRVGKQPEGAHVIGYVYKEDIRL